MKRRDILKAVGLGATLTLGKVSNPLSKDQSQQAIIENLNELIGEDPKVYSGYKNLDSLTKGFAPGELILIAGRPSEGKTTLSLNFLRNMVKNQNLSIAYFSLEMSRKSLVQRLMSLDSKTPRGYLTSKRLTHESQWSSLVHSSAMLSDADIYIDDHLGYTASDIYSKCKRSMLDNPLDVIFIDYLQLIKSEDKQRGYYEREFYTVHQLKKMALELKVPVIITSSIRKKIENRIDNIPRLADLDTPDHLIDQTLIIHRDSSERGQSERPKVNLNVFNAKCKNIGNTQLRLNTSWGEFIPSNET